MPYMTEKHAKRGRGTLHQNLDCPQAHGVPLVPAPDNVTTIPCNHCNPRVRQLVQRAQLERKAHKHGH